MLWERVSEAWSSCGAGEGFFEEVTFEILQLCLELLRRVKEQMLTLFHPFTCPYSVLSLGTLLPPPCLLFGPKRASLGK